MNANADRKGAAGRIARYAILAITLAAVVVILVRNDDTIETLRDIDPAAIVLIVALQAAYLVPQAFRYWLILDTAAEQEVPVMAWTQVFIIGRFLNVAFAQAGNVYRALTLKRRYGVTYTEYVTSFVAFTWLATLLNLILAALVVAVTRPGYTVGGIPVLAILALTFVAGIALPIALSRFIRPAADHATALQRLQSRAATLLQTSVAMLRNRRLLGRFIGVGLIGFALVVLIFDLSFRSVGIDIALAETVLFYVLLQLTTYLVITPGNLGIQELSFGGLAEALGIGLAPGLLAGAVIRVTGIAALVVLGLALGGIRAGRETRENPFEMR
ncbi:MAG: lysylphosphatidylglycerol synthase transmembrane domain-containing protein [Acidimicrobiia bacterium]|nr:lysylphosphatidylglycerol synthase transmembrane domain-containing protein [Acidimicrobiia bacterium]